VSSILGRIYVVNCKSADIARWENVYNLTPWRIITAYCTLPEDAKPALDRKEWRKSLAIHSREWMSSNECTLHVKRLPHTPYWARIIARPHSNLPIIRNLAALLIAIKYCSLLLLLLLQTYNLSSSMFIKHLNNYFTLTSWWRRRREAAAISVVVAATIFVTVTTTINLSVPHKSQPWPRGFWMAIWTVAYWPPLSTYLT